MCTEIINTRFYIDFDNSDYSGAEKRINNIKRIWKNRQLFNC